MHPDSTEYMPVKDVMIVVAGMPILVMGVLSASVVYFVVKCQCQ